MLGVFYLARYANLPVSMLNSPHFVSNGKFSQAKVKYHSTVISLSYIFSSNVAPFYHDGFQTSFILSAATILMLGIAVFKIHIPSSEEK